jgi:Mrp family chromosome partitioning ATPase
MTQSILPHTKPISLADITSQAERAVAMMEQIRAAMLAPTARKFAPTFSLTQLASMLDVEKGSVSHRMGKGDLPAGRLNASGSRREFTLAEVRTWAREYRKDKMRPAGAEAVTISIGNFKGGVSKTTTAVTLAQGLSLLGHRVLVIDTDPQGSLTTLFGILPDTEVDESQTILPLAMGHETSIRYAIRPTYWDGIDLVGAAPVLFGAEFALPARQTQEPGFEFWRVLDLGIDDVRGEYDVIVIDTPPALSYTTINAFMASDGIIMPLPPNALDFRVGVAVLESVCRPGQRAAHQARPGQDLRLHSRAAGPGGCGRRGEHGDASVDRADLCREGAAGGDPEDRGDGGGECRVRHPVRRVEATTAARAPSSAHATPTTASWATSRVPSGRCGPASAAGC